MSKPELDNLVRIKQLKEEDPSRVEYDGMVKSARRSLRDAQNESLDPDSQFDLACGAAHRLALAALRQVTQRAQPRRIRGPHGNQRSTSGRSHPLHEDA